MSNPLKIDSTLVQRLLAAQFPQWSHLPVKPVAQSGWDNRTFHLGDQMLVRMPSTHEYELQVEKEHQWLPKLAPLVSLPIPVPLAMGEPGDTYPLKWSIYQWIEGESSVSAAINDKTQFALSLAQFISSFQRIDSIGGPLAGTHSFYRGGSLAVYDDETRKALDLLKGTIDFVAATEVWERAISTTWQKLPVWVHGDISLGNLLVQNGQLSAVIDFGQLAIGDPACDLAITWTFFQDESREAFRSTLALDSETWARGRAWTLWKALMYLVKEQTEMNYESKRSLHTIKEVLNEHQQKRNL